jgi:hypothetical protein
MQARTAGSHGRTVNAVGDCATAPRPRGNNGAMLRVLVSRGWFEDQMNRRDQELLARQMKRFQPPPPRGSVIILVMVGVFLAGMTVGSLLFRSQPTVQTASSDGKTALAFFLNGTQTATR